MITLLHSNKKTHMNFEKEMFEMDCIEFTFLFPPCKICSLSEVIINIYIQIRGAILTYYNFLSQKEQFRFMYNFNKV